MNSIKVIFNCVKMTGIYNDQNSIGIYNIISIKNGIKMEQKNCIFDKEISTCDTQVAYTVWNNLSIWL